ncbi:ABC transporter substrate-binding protein [Clostridium aceticum]|nr:ABC transporter substrate-binding protein [Clostridium aceticum]
MNVNFLGLLPCALKVPFEACLGSHVKKFENNKNLFKYSVVSNANNELSFFTKLNEMKEFSWLPDMVMAPGFNGFFYKSFMEKYKSSHFEAVIPSKINPLWKQLCLSDPEENYTIFGFNPTVFLVDRTVHKEVPVPKRWRDLLEPEYINKVAIRGHNRSGQEIPMEFCEGILLNMYKEEGEEGIKKLGRAVKWSLHPSQMIKMAGSKKSDVPAVSAVPYSFAKLVKESEDISIVWPEDGAIVNPITLLVKNSNQEKNNEMLEFLLNEFVGGMFAEVGFVSMHPETKDHFPENISYKWLGWDFIHGYDLEEMKTYLNKVFWQTFGGRDL